MVQSHSLVSQLDIYHRQTKPNWTYYINKYLQKTEKKMTDLCLVSVFNISMDMATFNPNLHIMIFIQSCLTIR